MSPAAMRWLAAGIALSAIVAASAPAQEPPAKRFRESVTFETNSVMAKKFAGAQDYLAAKQWSKAIDVIIDVADDHPGAVIGVSQGRYVNVGLYCHLIIAGLPAEAQAAYRRKVDPQARQWFEAGQNGDDAALERIVQQSFVSSYGDDAAALLAERAWDRGDLAAARRFWELLLPFDQPVEPGRPVMALRYPDPSVPRAEILARLVLCSILEGNVERARRELAGFERIEPNADGRLAGKQGRLVTILRDALDESKSWPFDRPALSMSTFAGTPQRTIALPEAVDVGAPLWSVPLPKLGFDLPSPRPDHRNRAPLCYYPVVRDDVVFANAADRILAWDLIRGKPAWGNDAVDGKIYPAGDTEDFATPIDPIGVPRFTMTIDGDFLYARLGTPVTGRKVREIRELKSVLVCLDVGKRQGRLEWETAADDVAVGESEWVFEGSPVVHRGRAYVAMRKSQPQTQFNVACLDAATGERIWMRKVCTAVSPPFENRNILSHHLLTLDEGTLYYSTDTGAVAAIDAQSGDLRWAVAYESREPEGDAPPILSDHLTQGLLPCVAWDGLVFAAPNDAIPLMALDADTGAPVWERRLRGGVRHLLGITPDGLLIASGERLWGLDARTGEIVWQTAASDPESSGYGRGIIAGEFVYWPKRDELWRVHHRRDRTGERIESIVRLHALHKEWGGNLTIAEGRLLIAQPEKLVAFGEYGRLREKAKSEISRNPGDPVPRLQMARLEEATGSPEAAVTHFREAAALTDATGAGSRSAVLAARHRLPRLLRELADAADAAGDPALARQRLNESIESAPDAEQRAESLLRLADWGERHNDGRVLADACRRIARDPQLASVEREAGRVGPAGELLVPVQRIADARMRKLRAMDGGAATRESRDRPAENDRPPGPQARSPPWRRAWEYTAQEGAAILVPGGHPPTQSAATILASGRDLTCLSTETGQVRWSIPLSDRVVWARWESSQLLIGTPRGLRGVDPATGAARWELTFDSMPPNASCPPNAACETDSSPACFAMCGSHAICQLPNGDLLAVDPSRGSIDWRFRFGRHANVRHSRTLREIGRSANRDSDSNDPRPPFLATSSHVALPIGRLTATLDSNADGLPSLRSAPGLPGGWAQRPVVCGDGMAVVSPGRRICGLSSDGSERWTYGGAMSAANAEPALLSHGSILLLVVDGDTLVRLSPDSGESLWRRPLCEEPIRHADEAIAMDGSQAYAVGDGILRGFSLRDGRTVWEVPVGQPSSRWNTAIDGDFVVAWPERIDATTETGNPVVVIADTGELVQRFRIDRPARGSIPVTWNRAGSGAVLSAGIRVTFLQPK